MLYGSEVLRSLDRQSDSPKRWREGGREQKGADDGASRLNCRQRESKAAGHQLAKNSWAMTTRGLQDIIYVYKP